MQEMFEGVLRGETLTSLFQPIVDLSGGAIVGYEGLIRGPEHTPLHAPTMLFDVARQHGRVTELEALCHRKHIDSFARLKLPGKLFLNMSPDVLVDTHFQGCILAKNAFSLGQGVGNIVMEVTEAATSASYDQLRVAARSCRDQGLKLAIDDLGDAYASLRLWSELRPEFVKIDRYFVRDVDKDPVKRQFVRSMVDIALETGALLVAEGIETQAELAMVRKLGVAFGQGYLLGTPTQHPAHVLAPKVADMLSPRPCTDSRRGVRPGRAIALTILREVPTVSDTVPTNEVYAIFQASADLQVLAVLRNGEPLGLIHRTRMLDRLARPYQRELYGNKPCAHFIENAPLIVDQHTSLQELAHRFTENNPHHLFEGFIITAWGRFIGVGTGFDLLREITQMQMDAARYANPLTQLPGNVPINEHIEMLLLSDETFVVCYADLDQFKPFNDLYGYRQGDEAIQLTADLLRSYADPDLDFVGHIGGDDFIVVFRSVGWRERAQSIVDGFAAATCSLYRPEHLEARGYMAVNRLGQEVFHPLLSISLGIVQVPADRSCSSIQIAELATAAKAQAKKIRGNAMFVERRALP